MDNIPSMSVWKVADLCDWVVLPIQNIYRAAGVKIELSGGTVATVVGGLVHGFLFLPCIIY